jgi:putative transposase
VKFAFIDAEKAFHRITKLCRLLKVSRAGFYAWCGRPPSARAVEDARLAILVREAHERSRRTYGSPRVLADLEAQKIFVSRKRVIRLMQAEKLVARQRRRYRSTTMSDHDQPIAPNLLDRKFEATRPNEKWVGDTTGSSLARAGCSSQSSWTCTHASSSAGRSPRRTTGTSP